jgi:hypothetical protein
VIIATEADRAARIVADALPAIAATLDSVRYEPLTVVHWRAGASTPLPRGFGMLAAPHYSAFNWVTFIVVLVIAKLVVWGAYKISANVGKSV